LPTLLQKLRCRRITSALRGKFFSGSRIFSEPVSFLIIRLFSLPPVPNHAGSESYLRKKGNFWRESCVLELSVEQLDSEMWWIGRKLKKRN
jgi:hypothetical protein